jgi:hypothetical protein
VGRCDADVRGSADLDAVTVGALYALSQRHLPLEHPAAPRPEMGGVVDVPGIRPIGTAANKASVVSFVIPGIPNESIAHHLDNHGIAVRSGHHCAMPAQRHFGLESTVRPSLVFYNTYNEVDTLVQVLQRLPRPELARLWVGVRAE